MKTLKYIVHSTDLVTKVTINSHHFLEGLQYFDTELFLLILQQLLTVLYKPDNDKKVNTDQRNLQMAF